MSPFPSWASYFVQLQHKTCCDTAHYNTTIFVETDSMRVGYILLMDKKEGTRKLFY